MKTNSNSWICRWIQQKASVNHINLNRGLGLNELKWNPNTKTVQTHKCVKLRMYFALAGLLTDTGAWAGNGQLIWLHQTVLMFPLSPGASSPMTARSLPYSQMDWLGHRCATWAYWRTYVFDELAMPIDRVMSHVWSVTRCFARRPGHSGREMPGKMKKMWYTHTLKCW